ncbi:Protein DEK, partial [Stegodyphus mimosarum]
MPSPPDIKDDESKIQVEDQESTYDSSKDDDKDSIKEDVSKDESEDENEEDDDSDASSEDDEPIEKRSKMLSPPDIKDDESKIQVEDQESTYDSSKDDDKDSIKEDVSKDESEDENEEDDDSDASSEDDEPIEKRRKMPSPPDIKDDESKIQVEDQESTYDSSKDDDKDSIKEDVSKDESEDENEEVCLLDRSVEITGCRARKKIEHLDLSFPTPKEKQELPLGKGQKLGECPRIKFQIQKNKLPDLKPLHRILFNRLGSGNEIKKNIRKFCGFAFEKNSKEYERKKATVERLTAPILKHVCEVLDLERSGTKEEIVLRILEFLLNPKDSGKKVPS